MRSVHSLAATAAAVALLVFGAHAVAQDSALQFTQRRPDTAQAVPGKALTYGQSITDGCIDWKTTVEVLTQLADAVEARRNLQPGKFRELSA